MLDLLRVRSVYHLKEADPTTWVIPRLPRAAEGGARGAAVRRVRRRRPGPAARAALRPRHGGERAAARARRLRRRGAGRDPRAEQRAVACSGCSAGSAAPRWATSRPSRRPARCRRVGWRRGCERLGFPAEMVGYYAEHVEADAVHEQVAAARHLRRAGRRGARALEPTCGSALGRASTSRTGPPAGCWPRGGWRRDPRAADVLLCPGGPMLLRGDHVVVDDDGVEHRDHAAGLGGVPLRQVGVEALVRRHPQAAAAEAAALTLGRGGGQRRAVSLGPFQGIQMGRSSPPPGPGSGGR